MKKTILFILVLMSFVFQGWAADKFLAELSGSYLIPNDSAFKDVYGQGGFVPEIRLQYNLGPTFYIWGGAGIFSKKGLTPQVQKDAQSSQIYLSLGGGYIAKLSEKISLHVGPGLFLVAYKEKIADDSEQNGSRLGLRVDADLLYALGDKFVAGITTGYATASATVEDVSFKMGGFRIGAVAGIRF
jgi:hypothetical protein